MISYEDKPIPKSIVVFGAAGRVGGPVARFMRYKAPSVKLRLVTSKPSNKEQLQSIFPEAEVVLADYFDGTAMNNAVKGMEGIFIHSPSGLDEERAMPLFVSAVRNANTVIHIVRILGDPPGMTLSRVPAKFREAGIGTQHLIARRILEDSGLPITYLNVAASFMDNVLLFRQGIQRDRRLVLPERWVTFIDPRDVGEIAGRLLLSDDRRLIHQHYNLDNGQDRMTYADVVQMMSDVFQVQICYDGSKDAFIREYGPAIDRRYGRRGAAEYILKVFEFEAGVAVWPLSDVAEVFLGRKPTTMRAWLQEHKQILCPSAIN